MEEICPPDWKSEGAERGKEKKKWREGREAGERERVEKQG